MHSSKIITVLVVDDHPLALEGIRSMLSKTSDIKIIGEAQDGRKIKKLIAKLRPQILLLDFRMPNLSPVELEKWVRENYPETITLVFTAHHHAAYLADMMDAGAAGYLDKQLAGSDLVDSIRRAARGEILYDEGQIKQAHEWREQVSTKWKSLTKRERELLRHLAKGEDNKTMAEALDITIKTVEFHMTNIMKKLNMSSRDEVIVWMLEHRPDDPDAIKD